MDEPFFEMQNFNISRRMTVKKVDYSDLCA